VGSRSGPPRAANNRGRSQRAAGTSRNISQEDDEFVDEIEEERNLVEEVPDTHFKKLPRKIWRSARMSNPYARYEQRTCEDDPRFWTNFQAKAWHEWYMSLKETVVEQKALDEDYYNCYINTSFHHIHSTLVTMDILKLALVKESYCPELVSQFYCTVAFKDDTLRTMTWICGHEQVESNLHEFAASLGYVWNSTEEAHGYKIHGVSEFDNDVLKFCYPPSIEEPYIPFITEMYPHYNLLAKIFHENIVGKSRDVSAVRGYMVNLLYYTKPSRVRKIDVMDFIYKEIYFGVMEKCAPAYAPFIQAFINRVVGDTVMRERTIKEPMLFSPNFVRGPSLPEHGRDKGPQVEASSDSNPPIKKKKKVSKWKRAIQSIFYMCKSADARAFEANERSKRMARAVNARRRAQGEDIVDGSSLEPSELVEYDDPYASGDEVVQPHRRDDIPSASSHDSESHSEY
jgi:hypothetical protein